MEQLSENKKKLLINIDDDFDLGKCKSLPPHGDRGVRPLSGIAHCVYFSLAQTKFGDI